ncbi:MAG: U32 family peptidase [Blautia sp.]|nr:U32 family peptidase [Blautia sp.]MDY5032039.1 DUF3656 domain-containing protein [Blautia sp.]
MREWETELLSPAGSFESFEAALEAGADAVYVGGNAFGARAYAKNFSREELLEAIRRSHLCGRKLYLTVNTLVKNAELQSRLYDYLAPYYEAGLDAVIVQDFGVLSFIRKYFPDMEIHASTQMTVTGPAGMKYLESLGVSRIVPARELSLEEIREMHRSSPIQIETFIHGALCYCYSGQCLMSSMYGGRSGNRGKCAQPCRLPYQISVNGRLFGKKEEHTPLNLKDMNTIDILPQILEAGVMSLKIEGRMKQPSYTAGVTRIYRKYLDKLKRDGVQNYHVEDSDREALRMLFSRGGSCTGYYEMHNGPEMVSFRNEKKTGDIPVQTFSVPRVPVQGTLMLYPGAPAMLEMTDGTRSVTACGQEVQYARSQPMEEERIRTQMNKLGDTVFCWEKLDIRMDHDIFIPVKQLNELRRDACRLLEKAMDDSCHRTLSKKPEPQKEPDRLPMQYSSFSVSCENPGTARLMVREPSVSRIYLPFHIMEECLEEGVKNHKEMYLSMPHIIRGKAPGGYFGQIGQWIARGMKGFLVRNLESYALLKEAGYGELCILDHSMYTWNQEAISFWNQEGVRGNTIPLELNEKELRHRDNRKSEMIIYGYTPLMISAQCLVKSTAGCDRKENTPVLIDRYQKELPAVCCCDPWKAGNTEKNGFCYNIIYNSIATGLLEDRERVEALGAASVRLSFTIEKAPEAKKILDMFRNAYLLSGQAEKGTFTRGHFKRGAE